MRVGYHAAFMFFHAADFFCLTLDRHVFVNEAQTAFLRQRDGQAGFGNGIHGCGQHRDIQADIFGQLGAELSSIRQNRRVSWNQENVVKR
ncbi:hypothetical protein D3C77_712250 [compost metagenome]